MDDILNIDHQSNQLPITSHDIDNELIESLNDGLRSFGESAKRLNETVAAAASISEYNQQIEEGVKNMNALNSLYELQLQTSNSTLTFKFQIQKSNSKMDLKHLP